MWAPYLARMADRSGCSTFSSRAVLAISVASAFRIVGGHAAQLLGHLDRECGLFRRQPGVVAHESLHRISLVGRHLKVCAGDAAQSAGSLLRPRNSKMARMRDMLAAQGFQHEGP